MSYRQLSYLAGPRLPAGRECCAGGNSPAIRGERRQTCWSGAAPRPRFGRRSHAGSVRTTTRVKKRWDVLRRL